MIEGSFLEINKSKQQEEEKKQ